MTTQPVRDSAIAIAGVEVAYGGGNVLGPITFEVPAGQSVAIIGPSGAGKTTLLRTIGGLVPPTRGALALFGEPMDQLRDTASLSGRVGMMQQRLDLIPQLSAKHNIQAGALGQWSLLRSLAALLLPLEAPAARSAAERLGVASVFHQRVAHLSGGEQQRVAFARLLVQDPDIMLADEPVSSLDPARAHNLLGLLAALAAEESRTLVCTLHIPELAIRHFDRIIGVSRGAMKFDVPSAQVDDVMLRELYGSQDELESLTREMVVRPGPVPSRA